MSSQSRQETTKRLKVDFIGNFFALNKLAVQFTITITYSLFFAHLDELRDLALP